MSRAMMGADGFAIGIVLTFNRIVVIAAIEEHVAGQRSCNARAHVHIEWHAPVRCEVPIHHDDIESGARALVGPRHDDDTVAIRAGYDLEVALRREGLPPHEITGGDLLELGRGSVTQILDGDARRGPVVCAGHSQNHRGTGQGLIDISRLCMAGETQPGAGLENGIEERIERQAGWRVRVGAGTTSNGQRSAEYKQHPCLVNPT